MRKSDGTIFVSVFYLPHRPHCWNVCCSRMEGSKVKTLNPNNKNPKNGLKYDELLELIKGNDEQTVSVGNNTVAMLEAGTWNILIQYHDTIVACIYPDSTVKLWTDGWDTTTTVRRHDWVLLPLGYRMTKISGTMKVYSISTGAYRDYFEGMIVRRGEF